MKSVSACPSFFSYPFPGGGGIGPIGLREGKRESARVRENERSRRTDNMGDCAPAILTDDGNNDDNRTGRRDSPDALLVLRSSAFLAGRGFPPPFGFAYPS